MSVASGLDSQFLNNQSSNSDTTMFAKLATSQFYLPAPVDPIVSTNPYSDLKSYDNPNFLSTGIVSTGPRSSSADLSERTLPLASVASHTPSEVVNVLQGKKEGSFEALATAY
jgi:hypothetical protein